MFESPLFPLYFDFVSSLLHVILGYEPARCMHHAVSAKFHDVPHVSLLVPHAFSANTRLTRLPFPYIAEADKEERPSSIVDLSPLHIRLSVCVCIPHPRLHV